MRKKIRIDGVGSSQVPIVVISSDDEVVTRDENFPERKPNVGSKRTLETAQNTQEGPNKRQRQNNAAETNDYRPTEPQEEITPAPCSTDRPSTQEVHATRQRGEQAAETNIHQHAETQDEITPAPHSASRLRGRPERIRTRPVQRPIGVNPIVWRKMSQQDQIATAALLQSDNEAFATAAQRDEITPATGAGHRPNTRLASTTTAQGATHSESATPEVRQNAPLQNQRSISPIAQGAALDIPSTPTSTSSSVSGQENQRQLEPRNRDRRGDNSL